MMDLIHNNHPYDHYRQTYQWVKENGEKITKEEFKGLKGIVENVLSSGIGISQYRVSNTRNGRLRIVCRVTALDPKRSFNKALSIMRELEETIPSFSELSIYALSTKRIGITDRL
jgi:hypothetical protein